MSGQLSLDLIDHVHGGEVIRQRDGHVSGSREGVVRIPQAQGNKRVSFGSSAGAGNSTGPACHHNARNSWGDSRNQGTWVHPQVAIHLAQWLSGSLDMRKPVAYTGDWLFLSGLRT